MCKLQYVNCQFWKSEYQIYSLDLFNALNTENNCYLVLSFLVLTEICIDFITSAKEVSLQRYVCDCLSVC